MAGQDDFPIILQARADTRQFERDIAAATERAGKNIKPLPLGKITGQFSEFNKSLDAATARVITFSATTGIINGVVNAFQALVKETIAVEKALADINTVLNSNQKGLEAFRGELFNIARDTAQTFKTVSTAALELSRQGLSIEDTLKRTKDAMILARISGLDAAQAVDTLTAAVNGFQRAALDTTDIVNKLATVDSNFAVSTKDLADALTRVGSTADDAGVSFNELLAAVTAVQQTTSRGGAVIGNAFKTIFTRLSRADTITQLRELGVAIDETQNGVQKLQAISNAIKNVDSATANTIKELSGGVFQINVVSAALGDLSKEYSIYGNALKVAGTATNEAIKRNEALNQTLSALSSESLTNIQDLLSKIGNISLGNNLKKLFESFNGITKALSQSLDGDGIGAELGKGILSGIGNFLTGPGAVIVFGGFIKLATQVAKDISASFKQVIGITTEADKQAKIQAQISTILQQNDALYGKYLTTSKGVALVQEQILNTLVAQNTAAKNIAAASATMSKNLSPAFTTQKGGAVIPKSVKNAAQGLVPAFAAESAALKRGVGGANGNDQLAYIPSFNYGGGKKGPVVANTGEVVIENFLGGDASAILNRDMIEALGGIDKLEQYGKVKNLADGFVPSFIKKPFMTGASFIGDGMFGNVYKNDAMTGKKGLPELVFKEFKPGNETEKYDPIASEYNQFKLAEAMGLPVAKVHGSLSRSKQRGGIFKEYVDGPLGDDFLDILTTGEKQEFRWALTKKFNDAGLDASDLHGANYKVQDNLSELKKVYEEKGYMEARNRALSKVKFFDGFFKSSSPEASAAIKKIVASNRADGYIPDLANAMSREVAALMEMGYSKDKAMKSVEVGSEPMLKNSKNPGGLGVYNTLQGQTSLADAFSDHLGENFKVSGKAKGYVPNLALDSNDGLALQRLAAMQGGTEGFIKGLDISKIDFTTSEGNIRKRLKKVIENALNIDISSLSSGPKKSYSKLISEVLEVRAPEIEEQQVVANQQRSKAISARRQQEFYTNRDANTFTGEGSMTALEALSRANRIRQERAAKAPRSELELADDIKALREDLLEEGKSKLNQRNAFSLKTSGSIFKGLDTSRLDEQNKAALRADLKKESALQRRQSLGGTTGIGLSIGASLASPFAFQGAQAIRNSAGNGPLSTGQRVGSAALETVGGATNALSFAAPFAAALGPVGLAATAAAGAIFSLVDALDDSDEEATRLTKTFEELNAKNTAFINGFSNYVQAQERLNGLIGSGARESDIKSASTQLSQIFSNITDEGARRDIIASSGDVTKLGDALAKAQARVISQQRGVEAQVTAAQENDRITTLGVRTGGFSSQALTGISRSLLGALDSDKLEEFSNRLNALKDNVTESGFVNAFEGIGNVQEEVKSVFNSIGEGVDRVALVNNLIKETNITKELNESITKATIAKRAITDLNKTIGAITSIEAISRKSGLQASSNAFALQQNNAKNQASLKFFNAGDFAQSQLSTGFDIRNAQFNASQDAESELIDLKTDLAAWATENRNALSVNKEIGAAVKEFVSSGKGDLGKLSEDALKVGVGSGENSNAFSELAKMLTLSNSRLAAIDDNAKTQVEILRQNLEATRQRIELERKANTLGGASGQIDFARGGLERFRTRNVSESLGRQSGSTGQFGRSENAQGLLEFQRTFGNLQGFDVRKIVPNAEKVVRESIKESLIQGFERIGVPLNGERISQINQIADVSTAKEFQRTELTPEEIGKAVAASLQPQADYIVRGNEAAFSKSLETSTLTSNTKSVPQIYEVLKARAANQIEREDVRVSRESVLAQRTNATNTKSNLETQNRKIVEEKSVLSNDFIKNSVFSSRASSLAKKELGIDRLDKNNDFRSEGQAESNALLSMLDKRYSKAEDLRKEINNSLNKNDGFFSTASTDEKFVKKALTAEGFVTAGKDGKQQISDEGFTTLLKRLQDAGSLKVSDEGKAEIAKNNEQISKLDASITKLSDSIKSFETSLSGLDRRIDAESSVASGFTKGSMARMAKLDEKTSFSGSGGPSITEGLSKAFSSVTSAASEIPNTLRKMNDVFEGFVVSLESKVNEFNNLRFGDSSGQITRLANAEANLSRDPTNRFLTRGRDAARADVLRAAQSQQFNLGEIDPNLKKTVGDGNIQAELGKLNADASFEGLIDEANEAFVSGFASDAEMKKIGIRISQGLNEYVDSQVKLGVDQSAAEAQAAELRKKYQEQLDKLKIRIPKTELGQFGQGFSARMDELKQDFNDVGSLGAQTADSLVDGFGDAFVDIVSGAEDAETATRRLLSSIAADIAKFYAKKAITTAITSGISAAGYNQGGVVRRASGGPAGGKVPALVMGGEYKFGSDVVQAYGKDFFKDLNAGKIQAPKYAMGGVMSTEGSGMISGGSGYKDDVYSHFEEGSFILRKSAVNKYGKDYLDQISAGGASAYKKGGKVQRAFWGALIGQIIGGAVQGAAVGAVTAEATGGDWKKGAMYGAIGGGIAGGIGGIGYANSNPNAGFGGGFKNSFAWTGMGQNNGTSGAGGNGGALTTSTTPSGSTSTGATGTIFDNPNLVADSKINTNLSLSDANRGYASGVGNNSLTLGQTKATGTATAVKSPWYKQAGSQLAVAGAGVAASMALAPKAPKEQVRSRDSYGSVTTYNSDGSVAITTGHGVKTLRPGVDFNSTQELETIIRANGASVKTYAVGGGVSRGSGRTMTRALSTPVRPQIMNGSGSKDDVYAKLKKGEFVLNDRAAGMYNRNGLVDRMNRQEIDPEELDRRMGVLEFNKGGSTGESEGGNYGIKQGQVPMQPPQAGGGGGSVNIEINVNIGGGGEATVNTKTEGQEEKKGGQRDMNSVSGQAFAQKVKALFLELVEQEKRPGGSLSKDNMQ